MKNYLAILSCWFCLSVHAQMASITYTPSQVQVTNPERGLYKYSATSSKPYTFLDPTNLATYTQQHISLLYRNFQLNNFLYGNISSEYLANMSRDFQTIRTAGMKVIVRFSYSESENVRQRDASMLIMLRHIQQLKPILQANSDVIALVQTGFIGSWGEWYYTSQAEFGGWGFNDSPLSPDQLANRKEIITALLDAVPTSRMLQLRNIDIKQNCYSIDPLTQKTAHSGLPQARIGFHNDCFLANDTDSGTFSNPAEQRAYLAQESIFVPVGGETCKLNAPRTDCSSAIKEMMQFHWSFLNIDYYPEVIMGFKQNDCLADISDHLGYRLAVQSALLPTKIGTHDFLSVSLNLQNTGYAAPYNPRKVYLVLQNTATAEQFKLPLATDPRFWFGQSEFTLNENCKLPENITAGEYELYLYFPDDAPSLAENPAYAIQLANEGTWESSTGFNRLNHRLLIKEGKVAQNNKPFEIALYPVPANQELLVSLQDCASYGVRFYDANGLDVPVNYTADKNELKVATAGLPKGLYFVAFSKNGLTDTRKFIVKH